MASRILGPNETVTGKDGHTYTMLALDDRNCTEKMTLEEALPHVRYKVRRDDGATIDNFPNYLLNDA